MVQNVLTVGDFNAMLDNYAGREITHTPITQTTSNITGEETLTDGTAVTIKAYFMRTGQRWDYEKAGFLEKGNAIVLAKYADSVSKNSKITVDGHTYRVKEVFDVPGVYDSTGSDTSMVYTACNLFLIS